MEKGNRAGDWLKQAESDLKFARSAFRDGFNAQTCFICQQASEKALKSILYRRGATVVLSHSLVRLCRELKINDELMKSAGILDQYYLTARYPDALPEGIPDDVFTAEQAGDALGYTEKFVQRARDVTS